MRGHILKVAAAAALVATAGCSDFNREVGSAVDDGQFGNATMNNSLIQSGQKEYAMELGSRFASQVPSTVNFAFNSTALDSNARAALNQQANFINQFPEVRFSVFGHTDLVGSQGYNRSLGQRRAETVVNYLASRGVSRSRLQALVSYGETRPLISTTQPELQNRRTVTEVAGFVQNHPMVLNGKYAAVIMREYITLAERPHPTNQVIVTETNPGQ